MLRTENSSRSYTHATYDFKSVNKFLIPFLSSPVHIVKFRASKSRFLPIPAQTTELIGTDSRLNFLRFTHLARSSTIDCCDMVAILRSKYWSLVNAPIFTSSSTKIGLAICKRNRNANLNEDRLKFQSLSHVSSQTKIACCRRCCPHKVYLLLTFVCAKRITTTPLRKILPSAPTFKFLPAKSNRPHKDSSDAATLNRLETVPHRNSAFFGSHWNMDRTISYDRRAKWSIPVPVCGTFRW